MSSTSKNRPSHHKYKSTKQFELKQSWKALRALNVRWVLPVNSIFVDKNSKASDEKSGQGKNRIKKTDRSNIIATNFVWEQLIKKLKQWTFLSQQNPRIWRTKGDNANSPTGTRRPLSNFFLSNGLTYLLLPPVERMTFKNMVARFRLYTDCWPIYGLLVDPKYTIMAFCYIQLQKIIVDKI